MRRTSGVCVFVYVYIYLYPVPNLAQRKLTQSREYIHFLSSGQMLVRSSFFLNPLRWWVSVHGNSRSLDRPFGMETVPSGRWVFSPMREPGPNARWFLNVIISVLSYGTLVIPWMLSESHKRTTPGDKNYQKAAMLAISSSRVSGGCFRLTLVTNHNKPRKK